MNEIHDTLDDLLIDGEILRMDVAVNTSVTGYDIITAYLTGNIEYPDPSDTFVGVPNYCGSAMYWLI